MISSFDIFRNPFVLLRLDPSASTQQVADAFDDAIADGYASEQELIAARQAILKPLDRLEAEVGALFDTPSDEWRTILTALKSSQTLSSLLAAFANVAPLSQSNLLAHLASRAPFDVGAFIAWIKTQTEIDLDEIEQRAVSYRKEANFIKPDRVALSSALGRLRERQVLALFEGLAAPADAIGVISACTKGIIASQSAARINVLDSLLKGYGHYVETELSVRRKRVTEAVTALRSDPDLPNAVESVVAALKSWNEVGKPLQLLEAHKGRDDPSAQGVFQEARSVAIYMANELSRFDIALSITAACQEIFIDLSRAQAALSEDRAAVEERIVTSKIDPLVAAIDNLGSDLIGFERSLREYGFGNSSLGSAKSIREVFVKCVVSSKGTAVADLPWMLLRSIAVRLNNEFEASDSALALTDGLLALAGELNPSEDILSRLKDDKRAIKRNQLEQSVGQFIKDRRWRDASLALQALLLENGSAEGRATLVKLKKDIERKRLFQYLRWSFWPAIILIAIVLGSADRTTNTASRSAYSPPVYAPPVTQYKPPAAPPPVPSQPVPPRPARTFAEDLPPAGSNQILTESNIRYCMFQKVRLEALETRIAKDFEITQFNALIGDYNSRCGSYRYKVSERSTVESELLQKRSDLVLQAERILNEWRSRQPRPPSPSQTVYPSQGAVPSFAPYQTAPAPSPFQTPSASTAPTLPPPIAIGDAPQQNARPELDLIRIADAIRVQSRLSELGYLSGVPDGTWGTLSRTALRTFRATNGLPASDSWDLIAATKLFSRDVIKFSAGSPSYSSLPDTIFPAPAGATMNPLNRDDAYRIHTRLRELGLYQGQNLFLWSPASRNALKEFKAANGMPLDDEWDATVEKRLLIGNLGRGAQSDRTRFVTIFSGVWAINSGVCPAPGITPSTLPLTITGDRAQAGGGSCDFQSIRADGEQWLIKAQCQSEDKKWIANITLTRVDNKLSWLSERGNATYYRC